jgi:hypothetical protein
MRLSDYMDDLSWSQNELARRARISNSSVGRALRHEPISRRNANAILGALSSELKKPVRMTEVEGLKVAAIRRRKTPTGQQNGARPDVAADTPGTSGRTRKDKDAQG